jgi:hypothetical protein
MQVQQAPEVDAHGFKTSAIQPATITEVKTVSKFFVHVASLELFKSVTLAVSLMDNTGHHVANKVITVEGAEYQAWNNDDQYLINLVAQKLGFTLA